MEEAAPSLQELLDQKQRIFDGVDSFGEGDVRTQARRFERERLRPALIAHAVARQREQGQDPGEHDLLISLSGFSPATSLFSFELLGRPRKVLLITSRETEHNVDEIHAYLTEHAGMRPRDIRFEYCVPTQPESIYSIIHEELRRHGESRPRTIIDITGGKKVMSAAAALAASQLDLPLCYIESRFDEQTRRPVPGSEELLLVENPVSMFGSQELRAAKRLFDSGAFASAYSICHDLSARIANPAEARWLRDLAALYQAWSEMRLDRVREALPAVQQGLARSTLQYDRRLALQLTFLGQLVEKDRLALLMNLLLLGRHYQQQHRYDFAAMLFYRAIEGCLREGLRLRLRTPGLDVRTPDYARLCGEGSPFPAQADLLAAYQDLSERLYGDRPERLPHRLGCLDTAALLFLLEDPLLRRAEMRTISALGHLRQLGEIRNMSILAHGYESVSEEGALQLAARARLLLSAVWIGAGRTDDLDQTLTELAFVQVGDQ